MCIDYEGGGTNSGLKLKSLDLGVYKNLVYDKMDI